MSIQWTIIATFLYAEIAAVLILLLPFISARRWQRLFKSRFLRTLDQQSFIYFSVFIGILVLCFCDAIREVRKYTYEIDELKGDGHLKAELQTHMKLFRAQRNFYISGFALVLWLILRRLVTLVSAQATLQAANVAALQQAKNASEIAEKLMDQTNKEIGDNTENADNEGNKAREEVEKLKNRLMISEEELKTAKTDLEAMKKQSESLAKEYDRVLDLNSELQKQLDKAAGVEHSKKDE